MSVRNRQTNYTRTTTTDGAGRYVIPLVPLGLYEVTANAPGFQPNTQEVLVTLGSSIAANFELVIGTVSEQVQVGAEPLAMESSAASARSFLTQLQILNLPSNGRKMEGVFLQTPTAQMEPECKGLAISGQKGIHTNFSVDGGDYSSTFNCGIRGRSDSAPTFSLEALQEFQVVRNVFSSEFGRATGGVVNMSTKSGTNHFHSSAFYLGRNSSVAAKDPFDQESLSQIHQFGGSLGGAIVRDRTFFFVAPEVQKADKPVQVQYSVLDSQNLRGTPAARALLAAAPEEEITAISNSLSSINRIDHQLANNHTMFGRFDFSRAEANNNPGSNYMSTGPSIESVTNRARSGQAILETRNYTAMTQLTSILSPKHINELRFQFARELRPRSTVGTGPEVTIWNGGELVGYYGPQASALGFGNLGFSSSDDRIQLVNNFSVVGRGHSMKAGVDLFRVNADMLFNPGANALYLFTSLNDYLARKPFQYQQFIGTGNLSMGMNQFASYVQDEWRLLPGLTLTPGFRYEAQFNSDYLRPTAPEDRVPMATRIPDDSRMFAPRLGVAWDLRGNGRTVIRAGSGLFYASTHLALLAQSMLFNGGNPELANRIVVGNVSDLSDAFASVGVDLASAPLDQLPVFTASQINQFFGNLASPDLILRAPT